MGTPQAGAGSRTQVRAAGASRAGRVRTINQDSYWVGTVGKLTVALVADGMGGHQTGEVASQQAVDTVREQLRASRQHPPTALARAVQAANLAVFHSARGDPRHEGMGTTLTSLLIDDQVGLIAHVGDSRAYLLRDGELRQLTADHSWVADRVRQGLLTEDEARQHRWRNVITNALGATEAFRLELRHVRLQEGDRLLLLSDGVSSLLGEALLAEALAEDEPDRIVEGLLNAADERGSPDNVTAVALSVDMVVPRPKRYALPEREATSVEVRDTMGGIRDVEDSFPGRGPMRWARRQPWYPYRLWMLGSLYLLLLFLLFSIWR